MKPTEFPQVTVRLGPPPGMTTDQVGTLPIFSDGTYCVSLWQMSWKERLSALIFGRAWLWIMSGPSQPPVMLDVTEDAFGGGVIDRAKKFLVNLSIIKKIKKIKLQKG